MQVKGVMPKSGITPLGHRPAKPGENLLTLESHFIKSFKKFTII